jgi:hypothetical protein|tara:strand:- start:14174 stop:15064 length:891 start_codon:yes stop_codon:yes gene_type:complete
MKIKVITSYKPGTWQTFAKRGIHSMAEQFPNNVDIFLYCEEPQPKDVHHRIKCVDLIKAEPNLFEFKKKYKNDPVANGKTTPIPNGVRRSDKLEGLDKDNESFLWDAVRFANKVFCIVNAVRNSYEYDYVVWIDADTYTFRPIPEDFFPGLLPKETMLTYLGREHPTLGDGGVYPECGFVGYNLAHPEIQNFIDDWEKLYKTGEVFKILEWHDSYVFWHLSKIYRAEKNVLVNDIGYWKGVKGHHVFVNSELALYIDHFKGKRKRNRTSARNDFRANPNSPVNLDQIDYWKKVPPS